MNINESSASSFQHPWDSRLDELKAIEPGWLDGCGEALNPEALAAVEILLGRLFPDAKEYPSKRPGIFIMETGGISVEWMHSSRVLNIEIDPKENPDALYSLMYCATDSDYVIVVDTDDADEIIQKIQESVIFSPAIPVSDAEMAS